MAVIICEFYQRLTPLPVGEKWGRLTFVGLDMSRIVALLLEVSVDFHMYQPVDDY